MRVFPLITVPETRVPDSPIVKNLARLALRCSVSRLALIVRGFLRKEDGAVTVDMVPIVAVTIILGIGTVETVADGLETKSRSISESMRFEIRTDFSHVVFGSGGTAGSSGTSGGTSGSGDNGSGNITDDEDVADHDNWWDDPKYDDVWDGTGGTKGTKGTKGSDGTKGTKGSDGTKGTKGSDGTKGTKGSDGTKGTKGTRGSDGTKGTKGSDGTKGTKGTKGSDGTKGTKGSDGTKGTKGTKGSCLLYTSPSPRDRG